VESGNEEARWLTDQGLLCCAFGEVVAGYTTVAGDERGGVHFLDLMGTTM
jgi:hypothetical protein